MVTTTLEHIDSDGQRLPIHRWVPQNPRGGVVVVQEIFGLSTYVRKRAQDLAHAGYIVDVPELYFRLDDPVVADDDPNLLQRGMDLMNHTPWDQAVNDVTAAITNLHNTHPDLRMGVVGFCYGGGLAYAATAELENQDINPVNALVSYYGSALPTLLHLIVRTPSMHHFGTADAFIPLDQVEQIKAHVQAHGAQFHLYEGADHAFDNPLPAFHHPQAAGQAWPRTVEFLATHLG